MKYRGFKCIIVFILFLCVQQNLKAQTYDEGIADTVVTVDEAENLGEDEPYDTVIRYYSLSHIKDSIASYKRSKEFSYLLTLDSLLKLSKNLKVDTINMAGMTVKKNRSGKSRAESIEDPPDSGPSILASPFVKFILWILAGAFILFILYKLFFSQGLFKKEVLARGTGDKRDENDKDLLNLSDIDRKILLAMQSGNFRLAVRYLYLQTLKMLSDAGHINYASEKTNYQYVRELGNKKYQNEFAALTLSYEYVWYGEFNIDQSLCTRLQNDFKKFHQKI